MRSTHTRAATHALFKQYNPKIRFIVERRLGKSHPELEDVVQSIWLRILEKLEDFNPQRGEMGGFVHGIAHKMLQHYFSRGQVYNRRNIAKGVDYLRDLMPEMDEKTEHHAELNERNQAVDAALKMLNENQRTILVMKYLQEKSYKEIAEFLNTSENKVKSRLSYAREVYRVAFEKLYTQD
ncbi:sigma-70 family RNA polymerase sigma factor [candidate division KSB1 bacterium]|nr:sigma-70 family RNA polymerase sigma factor [candidate division KSB1 bacterium]